jgi:hypothetical protein
MIGSSKIFISLFFQIDISKNGNFSKNTGNDPINMKVMQKILQGPRADLTPIFGSK